MASIIKSYLLPPLFVAIGLANGCGGGGSAAAPIATPANVDPTATADVFRVLVNTPTSLNLLTNDIDTDGTLTGYRIDSNPSHGSLSISGTSITYTPDDAYSGADSFT